jgi:hypothetical protein
MTLYRAWQGLPIPKERTLFTWLDGVMDAMEKGELKDPMNHFWDPHSNPEDRVVGPEDRPTDEWDLIKRYSNVKQTGWLGNNNPWGRVSER